MNEYTKEEANKKWCPLAQIAQNVFQEGCEIQVCCGSNCMMWRWEYKDKFEPNLQTGHCGLCR